MKTTGETILLKVQDLAVAFEKDNKQLMAVEGLSFQLDKGQMVGIVGESGCGKSVTSLALIRLLPQPAGKIVQGEVLLEGTDLLKLSHKQMQGLRGSKVAMIFQEPMTALNPVKKIGKQLAEMFSIHTSLNKQQIEAKCLELLERVGVPAPSKRLYEYPHQLSGGMRQRVMIAMALAVEPDLLIADEPTTALDVTIQAQILELLKELQAKNNMGVIMITHDLAVVAQTCDHVVVMYAGRIVEEGSVEAIFSSPKHPYTKGLIRSIPTLTSVSKSQLETIPGQVPGLAQMPVGCRFANRCEYVEKDCQQSYPAKELVNSSHKVACYHWKSIK